MTKLQAQCQQWKPRPSDVAWIQELIRVMRHDGIWQVPGNLTTYRIDKEKKEFVMVAGGMDQIFHRTGLTLEKIGWKAVLPPVQALPTGAGKASIAEQAQ